jgi:hypothetical protein
MRSVEARRGCPQIAGIAVIARNRRDRKGKVLPLIATDDTDLNGGIERLYCGSTRIEEIAKSARIAKVAEIGRKNPLKRGGTEGAEDRKSGGTE